MYRIQKLLLTDYNNFNDTVVVESPFAEVTRNGVGIRQVQLGIIQYFKCLAAFKLKVIAALTPSNFIIAADKIYPNEFYTNFMQNSIPMDDPEINTLELSTIVPLHLIRLSVKIQDGQRHLLRVQYCTRKEKWFEFGGFTYRMVRIQIVVFSRGTTTFT